MDQGPWDHQYPGRDGGSPHLDGDFHHGAFLMMWVGRFLLAFVLGITGAYLLLALWSFIRWLAYLYD
jgi:hypothetical protein